MAVVGTPRRSISGTLTRRLDRLSERKFAILVSVPALLLVAIFVLPPILAVFGLSFFRITPSVVTSAIGRGTIRLAISL